MQLHTISALVCIITCNGLTLRNEIADQTGGRVAITADRIDLSEADADDRRFWTAALAAQEGELNQLQELADQHVSRSGLANTTTLASNTPTEKSLKNTSRARALAPENHTSPLTGATLNPNPQSAADLVPALAILKAMYDSGKERIGALNARENKLKANYTEKEALHRQKILSIAAHLKSSGKSKDEFFANQTRDENMVWKIWQGVRSRQHKQFHTSLKIQHATMNKVKRMMDMYDKTISGKADKTTIKKELVNAIEGGAPEIMLLQVAWSDMATFCHGAFDELRSAGVQFLLGGVAGEDIDQNAALAQTRAHK